MFDQNWKNPANAPPNNTDADVDESVVVIRGLAHDALEQVTGNGA